MKKLTMLVLLAVTAVPVFAAEPLLLEPLSPEILYGVAGMNTSAYTAAIDIMTKNADGVYEATYTPKIPDNMVPQNAAAEGKPVPEKQMPYVIIETKQGRQSNTQWNPGGKGTKSYL